MLLALCACGSKTVNTVNPVKLTLPQLQAQLVDDSAALQKLQSNYQERLMSDFRWCDSMLRDVPQELVNDYFTTLNLAQAYLNQFDELLPVMQHDITYTRTQLTNLQNDLDTHFISDSLYQEYLKDECAVADTLHNRILYFQDRLDQQDQELQSLKKNIRKVAPK